MAQQINYFGVCGVRTIKRYGGAMTRNAKILNAISEGGDEDSDRFLLLRKNINNIERKVYWLCKMQKVKIIFFYVYNVDIFNDLMYF